MRGLGLWIWQVSYCFDGSIEKIIDFLIELQVAEIYVKHYDYTVYKDKLRNQQLPELAQACLEKGIRCWVWEFNYQIPEGPEWNAAMCAELANATNAYGIVANFEEDKGGYKGVGGRTGWMNAGSYATRYLAQLRKDFHGPLGGCSYRTPDQHLTMPWKEVMSAVDYNQPQLYYEQQQNPKFHLDRAIKQFANYPLVPLAPVWPAYQNLGWVPSLESIKECLTLTKEYNLPAASFWYFEWLHKHPAYVDVIRENNPWREDTTPPKFLKKCGDPSWTPKPSQP